MDRFEEGYRDRARYASGVAAAIRRNREGHPAYLSAGVHDSNWVSSFSAPWANRARTSSSNPLHMTTNRPGLGRSSGRLAGARTADKAGCSSVEKTRRTGCAAFFSGTTATHGAWIVTWVPKSDWSRFIWLRDEPSGGAAFLGGGAAVLTMPGVWPGIALVYPGRRAARRTRFRHSRSRPRARPRDYRLLPSHASRHDRNTRLMIDLHLHTTASDGRCSPGALVAEAACLGIRTMAVTDHDTMAGVAAAAAAAAAAGIELVPGLEITAIHQGRDVHMLAYYLEADSAPLAELLEAQRGIRRERAREIADRLARLGAPIDLSPLMSERADATGKSLARPQIAEAMVAAGHVASIAEAFDRFLADDGPAYVPHRGKSPAEIVDFVAGVGGIVALAHPGTLRRDELIPPLAEAGLTALEVYHSSHTADEQRRFLAIARAWLAVCGGSDHGPQCGRVLSRSPAGGSSLVCARGQCSGPALGGAQCNAPTAAFHPASLRYAQSCG